jgi:catechol 2,3-dioxygenase
MEPGAVRLRVADLERQREFYERAIGLRSIGPSNGFARLGADGTAAVELAASPDATPRPPGTTGLFHLAILVPDRAELAAALARVTQAGWRLTGASDHLVSEALYLRDPDGLGIEVYVDRPRSSWRTLNGEIAMATDPLDTDAVLAAGGGEPWTGMPRGTVMGHVHLHVGDIATASRFYHDALGLDRMVTSYPGALFLSAGGYHHHLGVNTWAGRAAPASERDARLLEWRILLPTSDEAREVAERLLAAGHPVTRDPEGWLASDPWGTPLRLVSA